MEDIIKVMDLDALTAEFKAAVEEHARRTGGLMVGDTIRFAGYEVEIVRYEDGCSVVFSELRPVGSSLQEQPK